MTKDEALRLALEALEESHPEAYRHIITAIRECLAKPEHDWKAEYIKQVELHNQTLDELRDALAQQEPVRVMGFNCVCGRRLEVSAEQGVVPAPQPEPVIDKSAAIRIATALGWEPKRPWVGLTDEEIKSIEETTTCLGDESWLRNLTRNLEAKLKEKNQ